MVEKVFLEIFVLEEAVGQISEIIKSGKRERTLKRKRFSGKN